MLSSNPGTVTVTISAVNDAPAPTAPALAVNEDTAGTRQVAPNDPDAGNTHSYSMTTVPLHGTASVSTTGLVSYKPALNYNGPDSLVVRVTDQSGAFGQVTIAVTVMAVNDAPKAVNDSASTPQNTPVTLNVLANDSDADGTLNPASVTLGTLPASGTATVNTTTGAITYAPAAGYSDGVLYLHGEGQRRRHLQCRDGDGQRNGDANQAPVASNGVLSVSEDVAAGGTLAATDPEGKALDLLCRDERRQGRRDDHQCRDWGHTYKPDANANGTDSSTFRASDGRSVPIRVWPR